MNETTELSRTVGLSKYKRFLTLLAVFGPGIIVMLANTDAGCIVTAAQSGAQWGYAMVLPQVILIGCVASL